jgi:DNA-binding NtrC family response regulator
MNVVRRMTSDPTKPRDTRQRVLLVDDDPIQLELSHKRLTIIGFAVDTAVGAEEALRRAKERRPDAGAPDPRLHEEHLRTNSHPLSKPASARQTT